MPSARLDPIIKVSSKETNWISAGICNWKLAFNDALWSCAETSISIHYTSLCRDGLDCVQRNIKLIRDTRFIWSCIKCLKAVKLNLRWASILLLFAIFILLAGCLPHLCRRWRRHRRSCAAMFDHYIPWRDEMCESIQVASNEPFECFQ